MKLSWDTLWTRPGAKPGDDTFDGDAWRSLLHAREKTALDGRETSLESVAKADVILVIGAETFANHPIVPAMIHKRVLDGQMKVLAVGDGDFDLPQIDYHLSVPDADIAATVRAMLYKTLNLLLDQISAPELERFRIAERNADTARILTQQGLDAAELPDFDDAVNAFASADKALVLTGGGLFEDLNTAYLKDGIRLAFAKNSGSGSLPLAVLKPFGNSAAAWKLGLAASKSPARNAGWKAGLVLAADGEVPSQAILDNFDSLEFLAVLSPFLPDGMLGQKADVMLPCPAWMEQDGTYTSNDGRVVRYKKRILAPPDSAMDTAAALGRLAQKAEIALEYESPADWRQAARMQIAGE